MNHMVSLTKRALAAVLSAGMVVSGIPGNVSLAAESLPKVYAAAYQNAADTNATTLPDSIDVNGTPMDVTWNLKSGTFAVPYETVDVTGKTMDGTSVEAQMEVIPAKDNPLVYFVDAGRDSGKESRAFESVKTLAGASLKNEEADAVYSNASGWGRTGNNFKEKSTSNVDITKKIQTGWYGSAKTTPLIYKYDLEAGEYTLTAGFYEWWNTSARTTRLVLSGEGMKQAVSDSAALSAQNQEEVVSLTFTVDTNCTVTMEVQNPTGGEAPVISWFAVAKGKVNFPDAPDQQVEVVVNGDDVAKAAENVNGLTYKGYGVLSGNSTSDLLMDYKWEAPEVYQQLLEVLFGGEHPLMTHIKMEMGNDGNNSTGADSCTMRFEDEEADVSRSPGFQLAADAKKINPDVKVSFLYWERPTWVQQAWTSDRTGAGYNALYKWYRETVFDAYEKYGYVVDYINPDKNETADPDEDLIKWFKNKLVTEKDFPDYMDAAAQEAYHNIKIIASDENNSLNVVPSMRKDKDFYDVVDAIGFHYRAGDATSTADYRTMSDVDDKEVWYSEGCASFSYMEYQENKNTEYGGGTIGGYLSPLALVDNVIKSFVYSRKTLYLFQPALGSFYEGAQYDHKEILSAREPWAGYIHYDPSIYLLEHFTKFAVTGWENEDNTAGIWRAIPNASANDSTGSDHLRNESGKPSYMTLAAPDGSDFSVVIVNNSDKTLEYTIRPEKMDIAAGAPMEVWETKTDSYFKYQGEALHEDGSYLVTVAPFSMVTVTTLDCDQNPEYTQGLPEEVEKTVLDTDITGKNQDVTDDILYADDYEYADYPEGYLASRGNEPRYTVDFSGAFAVKDGQLKQLLDTRVNEWNGNNPSCVVGDFRWANYKASVDVTVSETGFAGINIRQQTGMNFEGSGYNLQIKKDGAWTLKKRGTVLDSGRVTADTQGQYNLALEGRGAFITAWIDGVKVASLEDTNPEYYGRVRLGCSWSITSFDNLKVETTSGYYPYATQMIDNASDEVSYDGAWDIIAGAGGSNNDWYRSTSTSSTAGSSFSFAMKGDGFALIGANNASAILDVTVDGQIAARDDATYSSNQHGAAYIMTGLGDTNHNVTVTLKSGAFVLDSIYFLPYSEVDDTALTALLAKAKEIKHRDDVIEETWNTLQYAIAAAEDVLEAVEAGEATQQGIDNAYFVLNAAVEGILYNGTVVEAEDIFAAVYTGAELVLPSLVPCTTADGSKLDKEVVWDSADVELEAYKTVTVTGTVADDGYKVTAIVEVVPQDLKYFISAGTGTGYTDNKTKAAVSEPYNVVAGLVKDLKNNTSDAAYSVESGWGYVIDNVTYKASSTVDGGDRPNNYTSTDKYQVGLRDKTNGAQPMTYCFTLEAGEYELTAGYHEFYGANRSRDMQPSVSWTDFSGAQQKVDGDLIKLRSADQKGIIAFTVDHTCVVKFELAKTGGEAPVFSWIGIARTGDTVEAGYNVEYLKDVLARQQKEIDEMTADGYIYVEDVKAVYDTARAAAQKLVEEDSTDEDAIKTALESLIQKFTQLKVTKVYDSFTGAKGTGAQEWLDTQGEHIQAHGGQVQWLDTLDLDGDGVMEGGWIWYGEDKTRNGKPIDGVRCYTSSDLYNWTSHGTVLRTHDVIPAKLSDDGTNAVVDDLAALQKLKSWAEMTAPDEEVSQMDIDMAKAFVEAYRNDDGTYDEEDLLLAFRYLYTGYCITERPKMLYNESTGQYVLVWHADGPSDENIAKWLNDPSYSPSRYTRASMGFAVSDTPYGPFKVVNVQRMNYVEGYYDKSQGMARDMNVFIDDTDIDQNGVKDAYAIYSSEENAKMYISLLNADYTGPAAQGTVDSMTLGDGTVVKTFASRVLPDNAREAPALFKYDGYYYMITSGTSGWNPNKATYYRSTNIYGPYEAMGDPCIGEDSSLTFHSQSTCVFPVDAAKGKFMYMGDRWLVGSTGSAAWWSSYVWLPVQINADHTITVNRYEDWNMEDLVTIENVNAVTLEGQTPVLPDTVKADYFSGGSVEKNVTWNLEGMSFTGGLFRDVMVNGTVEDTDVTASAQVRILPASAEYVIDCNNLSSPVFDTVRQLAGASLLQTTADQAKTDENTWGYISVVGTDIAGKDNVGTDIYPTGWYALGGKDIAYQVTLPAGTHDIRLGFQDWWGQYDNRPMVVYTKAGENETKLCDVPAPRQDLVEVSGTITLAEETLVTITVKKAGAKDPILNWIVIEKDSSQETVDKTALKERIADAYALDPEKYTEASYNDVVNARTEAEKVYQDPQAGQADVDKAYTELDHAIQALQDKLPELDRKALLSAIATAQALNREEYTAESYRMLEEALEIALGYADTDVSGGNAVIQEDIDSAQTALTQAIENLVPAGHALDKSKLLLVIAEAQALEECKYTQESYAAVAAALSEAQKLASADVSGGDVSSGDNVTQDQIDAAVQALRSAIDKLVVKAQADKTALKELAEKAQGIDGTRYTPESYDAVSKALAAALQVLDDSQASQQDVDEAFTVLDKAVKALVEVSVNPPVQTDKSALEAAVDAAKAVDSSKYTEESYAALKAVLDAADAVLLDPHAAQESIDAAAAQLNSAVAALVLRQEENYNPDDGQDGDSDQGQDESGAVSNEAAKDLGDRKSPATYDNTDYTPFWIYAGTAMAAVICTLVMTAAYFRKKEDQEKENNE